MSLARERGLNYFSSNEYKVNIAHIYFSNFQFDAKSDDNESRPVDYLLHIGSFVLVWVEAWYMRVKVR